MRRLAQTAAIRVDSTFYLTMKTTVLIPAYNCAKTLRATLESVFEQTLAPDEVILLDDGSTDETPSIASSYGSLISVIRQSNAGVAVARNVLCSRATGDLITFIDADDIWHPHYLEVQAELFAKFPEAVGFFTGHVNFHGLETHEWKEQTSRAGLRETQLIPPLRFLELYNKNTGLFASMSYLSVPRKVFDSLGSEPFCEKVPGVEDSYLCTTLPLLGPVVFCPEPLVAYRITPGSLSVLRLERFGMWVEVFTILGERYRTQPDARLERSFSLAYASKRRSFAKLLMGAGETSVARRQLWRSLRDSYRPRSLAKSLALLLSTYLPQMVQPRWPSRYRN